MIGLCAENSSVHWVVTRPEDNTPQHPWPQATSFKSALNSDLGRLSYAVIRNSIRIDTDKSASVRPTSGVRAIHEQSTCAFVRHADYTPGSNSSE